MDNRTPRQGPFQNLQSVPGHPVARLVRSPKVLQVFEPGCDGVFRHVQKLVGFLQERNVDVDIAYSSVRPSKGLFDFVQQLQSAGARTVNLAVGPEASLGDAVAAGKLLRLCRSKRYDIVHAHSSKAGGLVRLVAPLLRRPKIFYTPNAYFGMTGERTLRTRVYTFFERLLSPIGTTINVSQDEATFAFQRLKLPQNKSVLIPNPVDSRWFRPASVTERLDARSDFTVPPKATVIGYASRFSPQKDPYVALNAFAALAAERPDVHLLYLCKRELIGEAVQFAQSHALAHRITFADYREDVRSFYHALDVFLITSRYEAGWPFVVLEAMASGLPIVASRCPGMSDIGNAGLSDARTFEVGSVEGCTSALREAISSRCESENNHRSIVEKRFSVESCFGRLLELYRSS